MLPPLEHVGESCSSTRENQATVLHKKELHETRRVFWLDPCFGHSAIDFVVRRGWQLSEDSDRTRNDLSVMRPTECHRP
jgi:hypothetical protein